MPLNQSRPLIAMALGLKMLLKTPKAAAGV